MAKYWIKAFLKIEKIERGSNQHIVVMATHRKNQTVEKELKGWLGRSNTDYMN